MHIHSLLIVSLIAVFSACGDSSPTTTTPTAATASPTPSTAGAAESPATAPPSNKVELASTPVMDLLDNRYLWHLQRDGLVIPFASEGLRKYTQEYSQPWGDVVDHAGRKGRLLTNRSATLTFPWSGTGPVSVALEAHGLVAGQRADLYVNDKRVTTLALDNQWQLAVYDLPESAVREGENSLRLFVAKKGTVAGKGSYGLFRSLSIGKKASSPPPTLSPVSTFDAGGDKRRALTGFSSYSMLLEVPEGAWLDVSTATASGNGSVTVSARRADSSEPEKLLEAPVSTAWQRHQLDLGPLANQLIELTLSSDLPPADIAWAGPRIGLADVTVAEKPKPYKHAILVVVDALRSDRLALYGKTRVQTPNITAEGMSRGITFLNNQAASPSSPPSHGSIQTGMIPRVHGVSGDKGQITPGTPTISTQLGDADVATAYYGNNPFGMARIEKPGRWTEFHQTNQEGKGIDCTALVDEMLDFATRQDAAGKRFFISSLPYETHTPYRYHDGITDKYHKGPWGPPVGKNVDGVLLGGLSAGKVTLTDSQWSQLKALYDGEAEHMDGCFARLVAGIKKLGIYDNTLIVLTSDHGEGMYEHGKMGHAWGHYRELGDVPLVLMAKGLVTGGTKTKIVSSHLDIVPTILDLMGVPVSDKVQGRSLVPLITRHGRWTTRVVSLEYGRSFSLRSQRWKLIADYQQNLSVFDLEKDPAEESNLIGKNHLAVRYLRDLCGFFLAHRTDWKASTWGDYNNHGKAFLKSIGDEV